MTVSRLFGLSCTTSVGLLGDRGVAMLVFSIEARCRTVEQSYSKSERKGSWAEGGEYVSDYVCTRSFDCGSGYKGRAELSILPVVTAQYKNWN